MMPPPGQGAEMALWDGCEPGDACSVCGGGYCQPPLYFLDQGVRVINRSRPRRVTLATQFEQSSVTGQIVQIDVFNTRSVNYDVAPGYYATIGRYLGRDSQDRDDFLEFTYWGMNTWIDSNFITGSRVTDNTTFGRSIQFGNLFTPFPSSVGGFNRSDSQTIDISSEMHNWELNLRLRPRGRPDQLVLQPNGRWRRESVRGLRPAETGPARPVAPRPARDSRGRGDARAARVVRAEATPLAGDDGFEESDSARPCAESGAPHERCGCAPE
jgi:hypothetical protein